MDGINLEDIQEKIITEELKNMVATLGSSGTYPINGFKAKVVDYTVVTII